MRVFIILLFAAFSANAQKINTFNNFIFNTAFSNAGSVNTIGYGEMLQKKGKVSFRVLSSLNLDLSKIKTNQTFTSIGQKITSKKNLYSTSFSIPVGFEVYSKNLGLGISQELVSYSLNKKMDSSFVSIPADFEASYKRFSSILSKNNTQDTQVYAVFTLYDSFAIKVGIQTEKIALNVKGLSNNTKTSNFSSNLFFISIRSNIEK
jgi:hypothetical protein